MLAAVRAYVEEIAKLSDKGPTEHTYRPALKRLIESLLARTTVVNEPKRIMCGAPDLAVYKAGRAGALGYIEAKDTGVSLNDAERSEQLKRYTSALDSLLLTNYFEFRWYVRGGMRATAKLVKIGKGGKIGFTKGGEEALLDVLQGFEARLPEPIKTPKALAQSMARLAHMIRDIVARAFGSQLASEMLKDLRHVLAEALIPGLEDEKRVYEFADMYAQTITYGLFTARCNHKGPGETFNRTAAIAEIPSTNPFLQQMFETIMGTAIRQEPYIGFVEDLVQLMADADIDTILSQFGKRAKKEDPILHFYETFLETYDPVLREGKGVYFTPEPIVSYIVESVDAILRRAFGLAEGLSDTTRRDVTVTVGARTETKNLPQVLILDPACGTGTFLYAVIDHIRRQYMERSQAGMWPSYVQQHLLPRIMGFELLMAPYAVAHAKVSLQLMGKDLPAAERSSWGYTFAEGDRLGVYLTNTLEDADKEIPGLYGLLRAITEEARAAASIKKDLPILVVIGNPPYRGISSNMGEWITGLLKGRLPGGGSTADYYSVDGLPLYERKTWLQDDYVKFIRWGQWRIEQTGCGILAFLTNHGYLTNPTFRGMRKAILDAFDQIYVLDLHGNVNKKEKTPSGERDENAIGIMQGLAISIFVKTPGERKSPRIVRHAEIWGSADSKLTHLGENTIETTGWTEVVPALPNYSFKPRSKDHADYQQLDRLDEVMPLKSSGIITARDGFAVAFDTRDLLPRVQSFVDKRLTDQEVAESLSISENYAWRVSRARTQLARDVGNLGSLDAYVKPFLYRPFDTRVMFYHRAIVWRTRSEVMHHMSAGPNLALITTKKTEDQWDIFVADGLVGHKSCAAYDVNYVFPLYVYPSAYFEPGSDWPAGRDGRVPNLRRTFITKLERQVDLRFQADSSGDLEATFCPEDVLGYIYALTHSKAYRVTYAQELREGFPRIPLPRSQESFRALCRLGRNLVSLHLLKGIPAKGFATKYAVRDDDVIARGYPKYIPGATPAEGKVYINETQFFEGISPEVWDFRIGGFKPCQRWLSDRRHRKLTFDDLAHYQGIVFACTKTNELVGKIEQLGFSSLTQDGKMGWG